MARKLFFSKRRKMPVFLQLYIFWFILVGLAAPAIYFFGQQTIDEKTKVSLNTQTKFTQAPFIVNALLQKPSDWLEKNRQPAFNILKRYVNSSRWAFNKLKITYPAQKKHCLNLVAERSPADFAVYIPWQKKDSLPALYTGIALAEYINTRPNLKLAVVFLDNSKQCELSKIMLSTAPQKSAAVVMKASPTNKSQLKITANNGRTSSINWLKYIPIKNHDRLFNQVGLAALGLFQSEVAVLLNAKVNAISWEYAGKTRFNRSVVDYYPRYLIRAIEAHSKKADLTNAGFWLSEKKALSNGSLLTIIILGILLIWFPVANQLYLTSDKINIIESIIASVYFTLVPLVSYFVFMGFQLFISNLAIWALLGSIVAIALFVVAIRIFKKTLYFQVNVVSAIVVLNIYLMILAINNAALFIILSPVPVFFSRIKNTDRFKSALILIFGLIPLALFFFSGAQTLQIDMLTPEFILNNATTGIWGGVLMSLVIGSILSLINRQSN